MAIKPINFYQTDKAGNESNAIPYIGFAGFSGSGKTTLIKNLLHIFAAQNKRVAVIKHAHHDLEIDRQGKDSYEYRHAGAQEILVSSSKLYAHIVET